MSRKAYRKCSIDGCQGNVIAHELCDLHYRRWLHHGDVQQGRPVDWGTRESHVLYSQWVWIRRNNQIVDETWWDFWRFVRDVGERPSSAHKLFRLDENKPWGPENFFWREKLILKRGSETKKDYQRRFIREYRKSNSEHFRDYDLRRRFGITLDQYEQMYREQNGRCAICGDVSKVIDNRTGKPRMLAVDHCHRKGHVRKLLCQGCNQGLGNFRDDPVLLKKAAAYLEV